MLEQRTLITAQVQHMARRDVLDMISASVYNKIKQADPEPQFRVYVIGHEGEAEGRAVGYGVLKTRWFRETIEKLASKIKAGIKTFIGHGADNSHTGRENDIVGEVVGSKLEERKGILHNLVATYIYPEYKDIELDVASIEADLVYNEESKSISDVKSITGIALGNSKDEKPAFPGAKLQACYQMFAAGERENYQGGTEMKLSELKEVIKSGGYVPSQLFGKEALERDAVVLEVAHGKSQAEHEHRKRTDAKFDDARKEWEKEKAELENNLKQSQLKNVKLSTQDIVTDLVSKRNLDDKQEKFLQKNLGKFDPSETESDKVRSELDSFIDNTLEEYRSVSEIFGVKAPEGDDNKGNSEDTVGKGGTPAADNNNDSSSSESEDEYTDPKKNELIPS